MRPNRLHLIGSILIAIAVAIWLPVRMTFFSDYFWADWLVDSGLLVLGVARFFGRRRARNSEESGVDPKATWNWPAYASDVVVGLPVFSVAYFMTGSPWNLLLLPKLAVLLRLRKLRSLVDGFDSLHLVLARLIPLAVIVPLIIHMLACGWISLGNGNAEPVADRVFEYVRAVYWAVTTLATVGYGDIVPKTMMQMMFAAMTMIVGVGFFGFVLSNVASVLARMDAAREQQSETLDRVEAFMRYNRVPVGLRAKVRSYYRYLWDSRQGYNDSEVLEKLPHGLRAEVAMCLNAGVIEKVPILRGANAELVREIVLELKPVVSMPGENIFCRGEEGDAMYFIHRGTVEILSQRGDLLATLQGGAFFGESALLTSRPRNATARASCYCDLFVLQRDAFKRVLLRHPKFHEHVKETSRKRARELQKAA